MSQNKPLGGIKKNEFPWDRENLNYAFQDESH